MRTKFLVVDDSKLNRQILIDELKDLYEVIEAGNGREALAILDKQHAEILGMTLDIVMPEMDGIALLEVLNQKPYKEEFPVMVVTSEQPNDVVEKCYDFGINDFMRKPLKQSLIRKRVTRLVDLYLQKNEFKQQLEIQTRTVNNQYNLLQIQTEKLKKGTEATIEVMGTILEYRNTEDLKHIGRLKEFTRILATKVMELFPECKLTPDRVRIITIASTLHDLGMIFIPDAIVKKPGKLTQLERDYMRSHTYRGAQAIENTKNLWGKDDMKVAAEIAKCHHERWDGNGYPEGLKGDEIPLSAQIVGLADVYDALITETDYKKAYSYDLAFQMITNGECGVFPPRVLQAFYECRRDLEAHAQSLEDKE